MRLRRYLPFLLAGAAFVAAPAAWALPGGDLPGSDLPPPAGPVVKAVDDIADALIDIITNEPAAVAEELPPLLTYTIHTNFDGPDGPIVTDTTSALLVPTPVDVDGDPTTGMAGNDVAVQLTVDAGRAGLRVTKLPNAPADLPVSVEAVLADPRRQSTSKVAFGYDAREDTAPEAYDATIALVGGGSRLTSFVLDVTTAAPGDTIGVIAEVFREGTDGNRVDPQKGRIDLSPVPTVSHLGVLLGSDLGLQQSGVDIVVDQPTTAKLRLADEQGNGGVVATGTIEQIPQSLSLKLTSAANGQQSWSYQASDRVGLIDLQVDDREGSAINEQFGIHLEDVPTSMVLVQDTATHATFQASSAIGVIEAGFSSGGAIAKLTEPAYLHVTDAAGPAGNVESLAFRILGLSRAEFDTGDNVLLDVSIAPGPFLARVVDDGTEMDASIRDLPAQVRAELDTVGGTLDITGSAGIGAIDISAHNPDGFAGRATDLDLALRDLPPTIGFTYAEGGGTAGLEATGGAIGSVDLLLTSGPDLEVDPGFDGIVLEDTPAHYALAVELNGLRKVLVTTSALPYQLELDKAAGPFLVRLDEDTSKARIEILDLPESLDATVDPAGSVSYAASAGIGRITAQVTDPAGVAGRATSAAVTLTDLPADLNIGWNAGGGAVGIASATGAVGSIDVLLTSGPTLPVPSGFEGIRFEDVPSHYTVAVRLSGVRTAQVSTGDAPYTLVLEKTPAPFAVDLVQGSRTTTIRVNNLPSSLNATLDPAGALSYSASSGIGSLTAHLSDPAGITGRATRAEVSITALPSALDLSWVGGGGSVVADAKGQTIGSIDFLLTSGPVETIAPGEDGVKVRDLSDRYVVVGRLTGLRKLTFAQGPPPSLTLDTLGGRRFTAEVDTQKASGVATVDAAINVLPSSLSVKFANSTTFQYRASSAINSVTLAAFDPDGISGRAKHLTASLTSVPVALDVVAGTTGTVVADALGGTVGLVDFRLTSGPNDSLASGFDGVLLNDLADRYVLHARINGLRKISGVVSSTPDLTLSTTGGRPFRAELNRLNGSKVEYTRATLLNLPATVNVRFVESGSKQEIFYTASSTASSLTLDTNAGNRWNLNASISNPLPTSVAVCQASDHACGGSGRSSNAGSLRFTASEHTTVNLFDCTRPLNSSCTRSGSPSEYIRVDNLRARFMNFDASASGSGESGHIFLDTNNHELTGFAKVEDGSTGFEARFNSGFRSENRLGRWSVWGLFKNKSGSITCNGSLSIRVIGIWIGVTSYLC